MKSHKLVEMIRQMTHHLVESGIRPKRINDLKEYLLLLSDEVSEQYLVILNDVMLYEYREVEEIWNLLPEQQWKNYQLLGIDPQREQILLNRALKNLKIAFTQKVFKYVQEKQDEFEEDEGNLKRVIESE